MSSKGKPDLLKAPGGGKKHRHAFVELSPDKQKENEKLRETAARRTAKLEQSRRECEALRQENRRLQDRLEQSSQETSQLQETLQFSKEELYRYTHTGATLSPM